MIEIRRGEDSLIVSPEHGGSIVGWTRNGTHLLRRATPEAVLLGQPGAMGCFPLVPYCNRIAWRRFTWDGIDHELAANFGDHPHAIHGVGWQRPWLIEERSAEFVTLSLRHEPKSDAAAWPFAFAARLSYRLTEAGLTLEIAATNLHSGTAPIGIGVHPYFPRATGETIAFRADGVWINRGALPHVHEKIPPDWDHANGRSVDSEMLDNCFTGWRGSATLPHMRIEASPTLRNLQVFTPTGADFFCVEPVSHVPDAMNRSRLSEEQGMATIAQGQTLGGLVTFSPI
jgi:aldose 1-epimerase